MMPDEDTNQEIGDTKREATRVSTISYSIEEDNLDQQQEVLVLGEMFQN